ncbi:MAG: hypothetical protein FD175_1110 [Beijerinckiaceae bacterium]|nr:MAG: hypothetical protein FD175_1110 [Beijerinckiaceae bacterium]
MPRPLDHFVIGVADLDAAGAHFAALGFTVGAKNRHPWGTENRIVQFADQTFLELVTVGDAGAIPPHGPRHFSFGAFVRDALARRSGLSMLVLKSTDGQADAAEFAKLGIGDFEAFDFARKGRRPDGSEVEVAFTLAFAADAAMPGCAFFTCQHHFPQNFWSETAQKHANGASGVARVTLVADNPSDHHIFLSAFVGERALRSTSFGIEIEAGQGPSGGHGVIEIISAEGFAFRYGTTAPKAETPVFAGLEVAVPALGPVEAGAAAAGITPLRHAGGLTLPATTDFGTTMRFIETGQATR